MAVCTQRRWGLYGCSDAAKLVIIPDFIGRICSVYSWLVGQLKNLQHEKENTSSQLKHNAMSICVSVYVCVCLSVCLCLCTCACHLLQLAAAHSIPFFETSAKSGENIDDVSGSVCVFS